MTPCDLFLRKPDSMLLGVYAAIEDRGLRVDVYRKTEKLVSSVIAGVRAKVEKEAEDESLQRKP